MGGIVDCVDDITRLAFRDYGRLIGRAFQIQDDLLEIYSNMDKMGKSLKSDILLGKKTYLMIKAFEVAKTEITQALSLTQKDFSNGKKKIQMILNDYGITQETRNYIQKTITTANEKISNIPYDMNEILYFSDMITRRNS